MEGLTRFDIVENQGDLFVVVESDLLPPDPNVVVIPLLARYPVIRGLNPEIVHGGRRFILATRFIGAANRSALRRVGQVAEQGDLITRAVDILMSGV